jgi:2-polyprenyl-3-methyl-5-hydroxy-6-metoxy-1,4-benzoquinol methylase
VCGSNGKFAFRSDHAAITKCTNSACGHLYLVDAAVDAGVEPYVDPDVELEKYAVRDSRLVRYLVRNGFLHRSSRVLDFGAGPGHVAKAVEEFTDDGYVACVEADAGRYASLVERGFMASTMMEGLDGPFDRALLIEVVEHLPDPVAVLAEIAAALTPDGQLFVTTPAGETARGSRRTNAYDNPHHVQFFNETSLHSALRRAGFDRLELRTINALYPREKGPAMAISLAKDVLRPLRARLFGHFHLTGIASKVPDHSAA